MKVRDICLDVVAYFAIAILLLFGGISEWKAGNKFLSILSYLVAAFMVWEGVENLIRGCQGSQCITKGILSGSNTASVSPKDGDACTGTAMGVSFDGKYVTSLGCVTDSVYTYVNASKTIT